MIYRVGLLLMTLFAGGGAGGAEPAVGSAVTVFAAGSEGYNIYRIPAIVRAANGDLLAFCEAREGGDASEIDLVMKRSGDQGDSWSELQVVQCRDDFRSLVGDPGVKVTVGNPAPVVDLLDPQHPGRIWLPFTLENDRVFVTYSDDHGLTWSPRREITSEVKRPSWGWYATGPVHAIQIERGPHRGRLVVPADHRLGEAGRDAGALGAQLLLSDDHGQSWKLGAVDDSYDDGLEANETTVVELSDGTLYVNTRDQHGSAAGTRGEAWSRDGGETFQTRNPDWVAFQPASATLDPPVVQCSLTRVSESRLVFCGPDESGPSGKGRSDLRLRYSTDQAASWSDGPLLYEGPAAYSDLVRIDDATIGVLFENSDPGQPNAYQRISFMKVDVASLDNIPN